VSIFALDGVTGQIKTSLLPSGDMAVACPTSGPLEQVVFDACRYSGRRNPDYGGWIVPSSKKNAVHASIEARCRLISK
jgi:hypothetical protein